MRIWNKTSLQKRPTLPASKTNRRQWQVKGEAHYRGKKIISLVQFGLHTIIKIKTLVNFWHKLRASAWPNWSIDSSTWNSDLPLTLEPYSATLSCIIWSSRTKLKVRMSNFTVIWSNLLFSWQSSWPWFWINWMHQKKHKVKTSSWEKS